MMILFLPCFPLSGESLGLVPFRLRAPLDEEILPEIQLFYDAFLRRDFLPVTRIVRGNGDVPIPEGIWEHLFWGEELGVDLVLSGTFAIDDEVIHGCLTLFHVSEGKILQRLWGSDNLNQINRFFQDMAKKTIFALEEVTGVSSLLSSPTYDSFGWYWRSDWGWWGILPPWSQGLVGTFYGSVEGGLFPRRPFWQKGPKSLSLRFGLAFGYHLGQGQRGIEPFVLHHFSMGIPGDFILSFDEIHQLRIRLHPFLSLNLIHQQQRYAPMWRGTDVFGALRLGAEYAFSLKKGWRVGCGISGTMVISQPLRWEILPYLIVEFSGLIPGEGI
ncbi:MAG: hypothetical protein MI717_00800 [Spirochaetales bacterium]|nr:hypothetical protein [Spirochaetales bacterium]